MDWAIDQDLWVPYMRTQVAYMRVTVFAYYAKRVGVVDKPQACWIENAWFVAFVSLFEQFKAGTNQFFTDIYQLVVLTARTDA